jgi:hypothetical protein
MAGLEPEHVGRVGMLDGWRGISVVLCMASIDGTILIPSAMANLPSAKVSGNGHFCREGCE